MEKDTNSIFTGIKESSIWFMNVKDAVKFMQEDCPYCIANLMLINTLEI